MPSYIETTLTKGENVIYSAKVSIFIFVPYFVSGLILMLIPDIRILGFIVWMVGLAYFLIAFFTTELGITNRRVIAKYNGGLLWLRRQTTELNLQKVESVKFDQSIFGRMLNYGTIIVRGSGGTDANILGISDPIAFRKAFSGILDESDSGRNPAVAQPVADSTNRSREQSGVRLEQGPSQGGTVFCTECGARNSATASFCSGCGNKFERIA